MMKTQLILFTTLFAFVYTSPLPQVIENVKLDELPKDSTIEVAPEEPATNTNNVPTVTEAAAAIDLQTETPTTTELPIDALPTERIETNESENKVETVQKVLAGITSDVEVSDVKEEIVQMKSDNIKDDAVKLADAIEPAAVASDEVARATRTNQEDEEKTDANQNRDEVPATTLANTAEEPEQPEAKSTVAEATFVETAKSTTDAVTDPTAKPSVTISTAATEAKTETTTAAVVPAVTTKPKDDSSEESNESQESDEDKS
ncbi:serrate RNA effector molecule homolog [Malaya genurostris]|uniref:serrate RNA effector molecule homolog n=1 Tax=Malaya genurostris TaxID=325434 RepID=UPI0026F3C9EF|nr:serrate RNA effector molecule homolog [Malaya genurostris]